MPTSIRMRWENKGFKQIIRSDSVHDLIESEADKVRNAAGDGYRSKVEFGTAYGGRWIGFVTADTYEAREDAVKNATLERALNAL